MPLYEYRCESCGRSFEKLRRMADADLSHDCDIECPECRSRKVERVLSTFATGGCGPSRGGRFT